MSDALRSGMHRNASRTPQPLNDPVFALQTFNKADRQTGKSDMDLLRRFLSLCPQRGIAEQIHIRCPERQSFVNIVVARFLLCVIFCTCLGRDHIADPL